MNIQIYTYKKNFDTQKAERFFKERRIPYQMFDMKRHAPGMRELQLFARRVGTRALVDRNNVDALSHPVAHTDDEKIILDYLAEKPQFLRTPIVRNGERVTIGADEITWAEWIANEAK